MFDAGFWTRTHNLDRLTRAELTRVFFSYPTIWTYIALVIASALFLAWRAASPSVALIAAGITIVAYPFVEYLLHRFVLHGRFMYKSRATASVWKRIHFDHHQDPQDLRILFGALYTTLPTIIVVTFIIGGIVGGLEGSIASFATGCFVICVYEFCHCLQHLNHTPKSNFLRHIKRQHLAHHFYSEQGNFGITSSICDHLFGTYYDRSRNVPRSPTVFNLGYTAEEAARYPWVEQLSNGVRRDGSPRAVRQAADFFADGA